MKATFVAPILAVIGGAFAIIGAMQGDLAFALLLTQLGFMAKSAAFTIQLLRS